MKKKFKFQINWNKKYIFTKYLYMKNDGHWLYWYIIIYVTCFFIKFAINPGNQRFKLLN